MGVGLWRIRAHLASLGVEREGGKEAEGEKKRKAQNKRGKK